MKPRTCKASTSTLFSFLDLRRLGLAAERQGNGAIYVTGSLEALRLLVDECIPRGWAGAIETRYLAGDETRTPLEGFPRISVHPCVAPRVDLGVQVAAWTA